RGSGCVGGRWAFATAGDTRKEEGGRDGGELAHDGLPDGPSIVRATGQATVIAAWAPGQACRARLLPFAYFAYCPPQPLSSPPPSSMVASSAAGGAMLPNASATAPRSPRRLKSGRNDGSLNVPSTTSGERSVRMLRSFGRGLSSRSRVSSRRFTVPSPTMIVSVVSNASAREVISPSSTLKSP